jgi:uncharacterized RDD family membrane protein YckC
MRFFNQINLQTPESVELEFTLAGIGNRSFALIIDYLIFGLTILLVWFITVDLGNSVPDYLWDLRWLFCSFRNFVARTNSR